MEYRLLGEEIGTLLAGGTVTLGRHARLIGLCALVAKLLGNAIKGTLDVALGALFANAGELALDGLGHLWSKSGLLGWLGFRLILHGLFLEIVASHFVAAKLVFKLVAAFDHRDIFIDPSPDPETSFAERKRMFDLPRSSWANYDKKLISKGGGVFERTAKSIRLTPEIKALAGVTDDEMTPDALIKLSLIHISEPTRPD